MTLDYYIVNAFSTGAFTGNPAAVCPLESWLPKTILQQIAEQNNLSETVFFVKDGKQFHIRWFTPTTEVPLCGHATLAAAYILYTELNYPTKDTIIFNSLSGPLTIYKTDDIYTLNFPSDILSNSEYPPVLKNAFNNKPIAWGKGKPFFFVELETEEEVIRLQPDIASLKRIDAAGVIITAKGKDVDFVS
ncbi:MAG: PhzF family phenazine biosynthesis protein, partial [Cytophagales bacterium]|nr:PhzF family phenazine biosynthesis protein [Cytophaga sp.]